MARSEYSHHYGSHNYYFSLPFERNFDMIRSTEWMQENWFHSISSSVVYVASIYIGQKLMETRKPFSLDNLLIAWNLGLALFSLIGVCRITPELLWSVQENSFEFSICTASFAQGVTGFWTEMFAFSKIVEFGDTAFIILRKRPLLFLHWYHHITVLIYTWHAYKDHTASGRWFIWMNYSVHAFMYTYYALRAMRVRLPKMAAMMVTILQIMQMVGGVFIGLNISRIKLAGRECQQTWTNLYFSFTIYFSYFLLFCNFFYTTYLKKGNRYNTVQSDKASSAVLSNKASSEPLNDKEKLEPFEETKVRNGLKRRAVRIK